MKRVIGQTRRFSAAVVLTMSFVLSGMPLTAHAAGSASLSLSPASASFEVNKTVQISIDVTSAEGINAVSADVNYNPGQLDFINASYSGSAFSLQAIESDNGSTVSIVRAISGGATPLTGTNHLATLNFTVVAGSGAANLSFGSGSGIARASDNTDIWNGSTAGGTYTLTTPALTAPPTVPPAEPKKDQQAAPAPPSLDDDQPVPVAVYNDQAGYLVGIRVVKQNGEPGSGLTVKLDDIGFVTDSNGLASFTGVLAGQHNIEVSGQKTTIAVQTGDPATVQQFNISLKDSKNLFKPIYLVYAAVALGVIVLLWLIVKTINNRPRRGMTIGGVKKVGEKEAKPDPVLEKLKKTKPVSTVHPSEIIYPTEKTQDKE